MGHVNMNDPTIAREGNAGRHPWRSWAMAGVVGAALAVFLGFLFREWLLARFRTGDEWNNPFPPGVLADYVAEDSEAVLVVQVRSLRESPLGKKHLQPMLQQMLGTTQPRLRWMNLVGLNPINDLDTLQISFAPGKGEQPLWLARGSFDHSRVQTGADKLQPTTLEGCHAWEYHDRQAKRTTLLAPLGDLLVVSDTPGRVEAAMRQANDPHPVVVRDRALRDLLTKVDRRQSLWVAASIASFGPLAEVKGLSILRALLGRADSVHGGITCADTLQAELHFHAADDDNAARLETDLKSICETASIPGAARLLGLPREWQPVVRLLRTGEVSRMGQNVLLRCRLAADQLD